ncbi:MAG: serine/threonine protein kinase [Planctomycetes bacterium]|nr:serine/threonine protein kinase [Planctomycetota bacterium]
MSDEPTRPKGPQLPTAWLPPTIVPGSGGPQPPTRPAVPPPPLPPTVTNRPEAPLPPTVARGEPHAPSTKVELPRGAQMTIAGVPASGADAVALSTSGPEVQDLTRDPLISNAPRVVYQNKPVPSLGGIPLLSKLGQGGMGAVYYGIHPRLECEVAVKVLPFHLAQRDPLMIQRFFREARLAAKIRSPHLVMVTDVNEDAELTYLVMEYVRAKSAGGYLKECMAQGAVGLAESMALDLVLAATEGLAAAHAENVIHRDVKPDNILIPLRKEDGQPDIKAAKLSDLGLASSDQTGGSTLTGQQACMGTPGYMSPEQSMDAKTAGKPSDIFSMGATLYALLVGQAPFGGTTLMQILMATAQEAHYPVRNLRPDVSASTLALMEKCLAKDPHQRYPDAQALLKALRSCREGLATIVPGAVSAATGFEPTLMAGPSGARPVHPQPDLPLTPAPGQAPRGLRRSGAQATPNQGPAGGPTLAQLGAGASPKGRPEPRRAPPSKTGASMGLVALAGGVVLLGGAGWLLLRGGQKESPVAQEPAALEAERPKLPRERIAERIEAKREAHQAMLAAEQTAEAKTNAVTSQPAAKTEAAPAEPAEPKEPVEREMTLEERVALNDKKYEFNSKLRDGNTFLGRNDPRKAKNAFEAAIAAWPEAPNIQVARDGLIKATEQIKLLPPEEEPKPKPPATTAITTSATASGSPTGSPSGPAAQGQPNPPPQGQPAQGTTAQGPYPPSQQQEGTTGSAGYPAPPPPPPGAPYPPPGGQTGTGGNRPPPPGGTSGGPGGAGTRPPPRR